MKQRDGVAQPRMSLTHLQWWVSSGKSVILSYQQSALGSKRDGQALLSSYGRCSSVAPLDTEKTWR